MERALIIFEKEDEKLYEKLICYIEAILTEMSVRCNRLVIVPSNSNHAYSKTISDTAIDYIISLDFSGFQIDTLLGGYFYNTVQAKQLHIDVDERLADKICSNPIALNIYIALPNTLVNSREKYGHLSNLWIYKPLNRDNGYGIENNKAILSDLISRFIQDIKGTEAGA